MDLIEYFNNLDINQINDFISTKTEEDLYIEFKHATFPEQKEFDIKNFSKCLSGFANSEGGIIIWGINASKNEHGLDCASEKKPIRELTKFSNFLKRHEGKIVSATISGIEYKKIEESQGIDTGYLAVYIPKSDLIPHMANKDGNHYFKRSADNFYRCEHFDIVDMFNRKVKPNLSFGIFNFLKTKTGHNSDIIKFKLETLLYLRNDSNVLAKYPMVEININAPYVISAHGIDNNKGLELNKRISNNHIGKYYGGNDIVIYPHTYTMIDKVVLTDIISEENIPPLIVNVSYVCENMDLKTEKIVLERTDIIEKIKNNY